MKSPSALGTLMPKATVWESGNELALGLRRLEGGHDRRAALGLHRDEAGHRRRRPTQFEQLRDGLVDADEADSATGGVHDDVGQRSSRAARRFQAHGLLALDAVRLLERATSTQSAAAAAATMAPASLMTPSTRCTSRAGVEAFGAG